MNFIIVTLILFIASNTATIPQDFIDSWVKTCEPHFPKCARSTGLSLTTAYRTFTDSRLPNDPALKCFLKCIQLKLDVMMPDGQMVMGNWTARFKGVTEKMLVPIFDLINGVSDMCDRAYITHLRIVETINVMHQ